MGFGVFRRRHDYRQELVAVAVLFPAATVDSPPLRFDVVQMAPAGLRAAPFPRLTTPAPLFLFSVDSPLPIEAAQQAARIAYRSPGRPAPTLSPTDPLFLYSLDSPLPKGVDSQAVAGAYRAARGRVLPMDPLAALLYQIPPDDPPLQQPSPLASWQAYRAPGRPIPTQAPIYPPIADDPIPASLAQALAAIAYRMAGRPASILPTLFPAVFPPVVEGPPLDAIGARLAAIAYRAAAQPQRPLPLLYPAVFPPVVDAPPLAGMSGYLLHAAYRRPYPRPLGFQTPSEAFVPPVVTDFPFLNIAQQLAHAAYRARDIGTLAAVARAIRTTPFDALYPVVPVVPPTPGTTTIITGYATKAQAEKLQADIAKLSRRLEFLIGLMEKGAGGKRLKT